MATISRIKVSPETNCSFCLEPQRTSSSERKFTVFAVHDDGKDHPMHLACLIRVIIAAKVSAETKPLCPVCKVELHYPENESNTWIARIIKQYQRTAVVFSVEAHNKKIEESGSSSMKLSISKIVRWQLVPEEGEFPKWTVISYNSYVKIQTKPAAASQNSICGTSGCSSNPQRQKRFCLKGTLERQKI